MAKGISLRVMTLTQQLDRPGGRIAFDVTGTGRPVVLSPGMGDLRGVFRDVVGPLVDSGRRVVTADLRGHGEATTDFASYGVREIADDLVALLEHLGGPATLVGHSVSAGAATIVAAERPDLVSSLVLLDPHLTPGGAFAQLAARLMTQAIRRPVGAALWGGYYRSLYKGAQPAWLAEHLASVRTAMADGAHLVAFGRLARALVASHTTLPLDQVEAPTLVVHGALDPEVDDPAADLAAALGALGRASRADGLLVPDAGHYPHAQRPDVLVPALLAHLGHLEHSGA